MIHTGCARFRRRRSAPWRRFFCVCAALLATVAAPPPGELAAQEEAVRILTRQSRVMRDQAGNFRMVESLLVRIAGAGAEGFAIDQPLRLVRFQDSVDDVRGLGGDILPGQIAYDPPYLTVVGDSVPAEFLVAFTYVLTEGATALELTAPVPVDEFVLEVQRGNVDVRPDPLLRPDGEGGPEERPFRRYVTENLPVDRAVAIELVSRRVDWRQRLTVLIVTAFTAGVATIWVWRRGPGREQSAESGA